MISKIVCFAIFLLATVQISYGTDCEIIRNYTWTVTIYGKVPTKEDSSKHVCFEIEVNDTNKYVAIRNMRTFAENVNIVSTVTGTGDNTVYTIKQRDYRNYKTVPTINVLGHVKIDYRITLAYLQKFGDYKLEFNYRIEDITCTKKDSLHCTYSSCVEQFQVCNGNVDCPDGKDEQDCVPDIESITDANTSRKDAISWLKKEKLGPWQWGKDDQRSVTALYLADGVTDEDEDESIVKKLELEASVALLRDDKDRVTINELATFVQSLLVTCHDPRNFYSFDLVRFLKDRENETHHQGTFHPVAILALCNANETITDRQLKNLEEMVLVNSTYPFELEKQALALMALSCIKNSSFPHRNVDTLVSTTVARIVKLQKPDGSFGNVYTTALLTQALISSQEKNVGWRNVLAAKFLLQQQARDSSFGDFLATYLVLPVLNGKSLADIGKTDCSKNGKKITEGTTDVEDKRRLKMHVKYSLYIGDELDIVDSIGLRLPVNLTAYQVMEIAAETYPKYKFESYMADDKMYVFSISDIANDPDIGTYWLFYLGHSQQEKNSNLITESPDRTIIRNGDHIIMWYKTASLPK